MSAKYQPYIYFIIEALILINGFLTARGVNPVTISDAEIYAGVSYAAAIAAFLFAMWKNHNFSEAARLAQHVLDQIKGGANPFAHYTDEINHEQDDPEDF